MKGSSPGTCTFLVLPALLALTANLTAQDCALAVRMGGAIPLDEVPRSHGRSDDLTAGPAFGLGPTCVRGSFTYGGEVLFQSHGRLELVHALGGVGRRFRLSDGGGATWIRLDARAGLAFAFELGGQTLALITGEPVTEMPGVGFALGGGFWLGLPAGPGDFVLGASPLVTFVATEVLEGPSSLPGHDGFASLVSIPIAVGYEFDLWR